MYYFPNEYIESPSGGKGIRERRTVNKGICSWWFTSSGLLKVPIRTIIITDECEAYMRSEQQATVDIANSLKKISL